MKTPAQANSMIRRLTQASSQVTKRLNAGLGCKTWVTEEERAAKALFTALTGQRATKDDVEEMTK